METYKTTQEQKLENARKHVKRIKGFIRMLWFRIGKQYLLFSLMQLQTEKVLIT